MTRRTVHKNFKGAGKQYKKNIRDVIQASAKGIGEYAIDLYESLLMKTPIDTGMARGSWQIVLDGEGLDLNRGASNARTTGQSMTAQERAYATQRMTMFLLRGGKQIDLINTAGHIRELEFGHSRKAPQGMVRRTVAQYADGEDYLVSYRGAKALISIRKGKG